MQPREKKAGRDGKGGSLAKQNHLVSSSTERYEPGFACDSPFDVSLPHQWFALRVKSNFERTAAFHLIQRGYKNFLPTYTVRTNWSDRVKTVEKPLFPGYVFCAFDPSRRLPVMTTPGVLHVVGIGKDLLPVDESELKAVWTTLQSGLLIHPWPYLRVGETVAIERGPLAGVEGFVVQLKGNFRLVVSITLLQRSISAEIERDWIRPVCQRVTCDEAAFAGAQM